MRKLFFFSALLAITGTSFAIGLPEEQVRVSEIKEEIAPFSYLEIENISYEAVSPATSTTLAKPHVREAPRLVIPRISLDSLIKEVGLNKKGEMDVPPGSTMDVGWYKHGTQPGEMGSAVLDAHVYAAFSRLHELKTGDSIYVVQENGEHLHFIVFDTTTYALEDAPREMIFNRDDGRYLNLITCAGTFLPERGTYDKRLVVSARLSE
jgi:sortase (surface protein transpeptidase)